MAGLKAIIERRMPRLYARLIDLRDRMAPDYGEMELALVPLLAEADADAYDIGANHGSYTAPMLHAAGRVVAFEPNPTLGTVLKTRFGRELREGKLVLMAMALGDADGEAVLHVPEAGSGLASIKADAVESVATPAMLHITVAIRRLDDLAVEIGRKRRVAFIKIDVEGFEGTVLRGALATLREQRPSLLIEAEERHTPGTLAELQAMLDPIGYRGLYLRDGRLHDMTGFDIARLQDRSALNADGTRRLPDRVYVNNFIFVARPEPLARLEAAYGPVTTTG
ncbi:FkbM family methyltransferase [Tistrella arctica]